MRKIYKWIIAAAIVIIFVTLFLLWPGLLIYSNKTNFNADINNKSYQIGWFRYLPLPAATYIITSTKDGYLTDQQMVVLKSVGLKKIKINFSNMYIVSSLPSFNPAGSNFMSLSAENKSMLTFSLGDNSFYEIPLSGDKQFMASDDKSQKIEINTGLLDGATVINIKYSPDRGKAMISYQLLDETAYKVIDLENKKVVGKDFLANEADWLGNNDLVAVMPDNTKKVIKINLDSDKAIDIKEFPDSINYLVGSIDGKYILAVTGNDNGDTLNVVNLDKNEVKQKVTKNFMSAIAINPSSFFVTTAISQDTNNYLLDSLASTSGTKLNAYLNILTSTPDGKNLVYAKYNKSDQTYQIIQSKNNGSSQKTIAQLNSANGELTDIIVKDTNDIFIVAGGSLMGVGNAQ